MSNHTYHVSLHRIDSGCLVINRRIILAAKVDFSAIVAYTTIVKPRRRRYLNMNLFQEQLKEGKVGEDLVYNWLTNRGYHVYDVSDDVD